MSTPRPSRLDLHPVEALLALLLISGAALHRLVIDPPRPIQRRQPQAAAAPAVGIAGVLTVAELRTMARQRGILCAGSRPIHKARRADLLSALGL